MSPILSDRFRSHLRETGLLAGASHLVVACSGGGDSTALLVLLSELPARERPVLVVAHIGHELRGVEGQRDARAVADFSAALSLPFVYRSFEVRSLREKRESLESAGRRLRYQALVALARDLGPHALIATGHTLDDQAETVLLHLERRLGRHRGAIRARRRDGVVRPLLGLGRAELREELRRRGIPWREDSTNLDESLPRNRIRLKVLPALEAASPGCAARLARAGAAWNRRIEALDERIEAELGAHGSAPGGPWPRGLFSRLGREAACRLLLRAAGPWGRIPGRSQLTRVVERILGPASGVREALAGGRVQANSRMVRLVAPARLLS